MGVLNSLLVFCLWSVLVDCAMVPKTQEKTSLGGHAAVLLGGTSSSGVSETYTCDLPIPDVGQLNDLGAAVLLGQIVYCGGKTSNGVVSRRCFVNELGHWVEIASMNVARYHFSLTALGDKLLAVGGENNEGYPSSMEIFDGSSWNILPFELSKNNYDHCAVPIRETSVLLIGGGGTQSTIEIFDIEQGFLEVLPSMPTRRWAHDCAIFKGEVYVAGGYNGNRLNVVEIYNPYLRTWRTGPPMLNIRADFTMEVVDDYLLVFGGNNSPKTMEKFDGESWTEEPLQYNHVYHASVTVPCLE